MTNIYALENPRLQHPVLRWLDFGRRFAAFHESMSALGTTRIPLTAGTLQELAERILHHTELGDDFVFEVPDPPAITTGTVGAVLDEREQEDFLDAIAALRQKREE